MVDSPWAPGGMVTPRAFPLRMNPALLGRAQEWLEAGDARPDPVEPRYAATVMLLRERPAASGGGAGPVEVFMLTRVSTMEFAPSTSVFPGGGVDPRDDDEDPWAPGRVEGWAKELGSDLTTARVHVAAAIREVFEECGILLASKDPQGPLVDARGDSWRQARAALEARELSLSELLEREGLVLRDDLLSYRGHWLTPLNETRRYDTRFFAAHLPAGLVPDDDTSEAVSAGWVIPSETLAAREAGRVIMLPPTVLMLEDLAACSSVEEALTLEPVRACVMPDLVETEDGLAMAISPETTGDGS